MAARQIPDMVAKRVSTLDEGFRLLGWPMGENLRFVQNLLANIDVDGLYVTSSYLKVVRRDGGKDIRVHRGASNGFKSEHEIVDAVGDVDRGPSERAGTWRVAHPDTTSGVMAGQSTKPYRQPVRRCQVDGCGLILYPKTGCDVHGVLETR